MFVIAGVGAAVAACGFSDLDGLSSGGLPADGGGTESGSSDSSVVADASGSNDATGDADDAGSEAGTNTDAGSDADVDAGACAGKAGPKMVRVGKYCVDSTEVTGAQYTAFVAANVAIGSQPPECAFNTSFAPKKTMGADQLPARYVNWCDARAYCLWAGKRLCGAIAGGPTLYQNPDITTEEWFMACSQNHTRVYPYGQVYDATACNGDPTNDVPVFVASKTKCEGGFPGLFDMSGNVREWQDACESVEVDGGGSESCVTRGGASDDLPEALQCAHRDTDPRNYNSVHLGFRCCSDAL